jgi:20S proteasome alpha/beta subunit
MKFKTNLYKLKEGREMKASVFSRLVSTSLYEKR